MTKHEGDDLRQVASAKSEDAEDGHLDATRFHPQQLACRELLSPVELAVLHSLEVDSLNLIQADDSDRAYARLATALLFSDLYSRIGQVVNWGLISRALDDRDRDLLLYWTSLSPDKTLDEWSRDAIIQEYGRLVEVVLPHVLKLDTPEFDPPRWDDRLAIMLRALGMTASPPGKS